MKKNSLKFILPIVVLLSFLLIYLYVVKSMHVFNHQYFNENDFSLIQTDLEKEYNFYLDSLDKDNSVKVTFNFHNVMPPRGAIIEIYSHKTSNYIYIGPYQPTLSFFVKDNLFEKSIDSLSISLVDVEKRSTYTIEQEKVFNFWKKGKVINIWFLPFRKYDEETGTTIGYTVSLD